MTISDDGIDEKEQDGIDESVDEDAREPSISQLSNLYYTSASAIILTPVSRMEDKYMVRDYWCSSQPIDCRKFIE